MSDACCSQSWTRSTLTSGYGRWPDGVQQDLRGQDRGGSGMVVVGGDLNQVDADDVALFRQAVDQFEDFVVEEPAVRGGAR